MDIVKEVKKLNLPIDQYAVVGSGPLAIRNLRQVHDIDLIVTQEIYNRLKAQGWEESHFPDTERPWVLFHELFDVSTSWSVNDYKPTLKTLIDDADIIDGVPFVCLDDVIKWKTTCHREKDLEDIELIKSYLAAMK